MTEGIKNDLKLEVRVEVREIDNQKARAMNLIVFNPRESESVSSENRKTEDINNFIDICSEIVEVEEVELAFRLGYKSPNKIRPLKIVMSNRQLRKAILDQAKYIRSKA